MKKRITGRQAAKKLRTPGKSSSNGNGTNGQGPGGNGIVPDAHGRPTARSSRKRLGNNGSHLVEVARPLPKTSLKPAEVVYFKAILLAKRGEIVGDVDTMEREALGKNRSDASGDLSMMPIHMADIGSDNYEQEFTLGLIANERTTLKEIDEALQRIADGTYGMCMGTHQPIPKARLRAKPWARYCVEYKRAQEAAAARNNSRRF